MGGGAALDYRCSDYSVMARFTPYQSRGRGALVEPTRETINGLERAIRWAEVEVPTAMPFYMNELVKMMALLNQGYARAMSFGPYDPTERHPEYAWKTPVRRISQRYYLGWKVKQMRMGTFLLYNEEREAYFIEFGINWLGEGRRVRRPVRKLSLRKTVATMMTTGAYHRIWASIMKSKSSNMGSGFYQIIQSPPVNRGLAPSIFNYGQR